MTERWIIPPAGDIGVIKNVDTNKYLTVSGSAVIEEDLDTLEPGRQQWERSTSDFFTSSGGYFTLRNPQSGKYLTASNQTFTIEGAICNA